MPTPIDLDAYGHELAEALRQAQQQRERWEQQVLILRGQIDLLALMRERALPAPEPPAPLPTEEPVCVVP